MEYSSIPIYSLLSVRKLYSIYHLTFEKDYRFAGEQHNFWELSYILSGRSGCTAGEKIYLVEQGDIVLHSPNLFHSMWTTDKEPCETFTISFDGSGLEHKLAAGKYRLAHFHRQAKKPHKQTESSNRNLSGTNHPMFRGHHEHYLFPTIHQE